MTTRVVAVRARARPGDTLMIGGRPHLILFTLPRQPGRRPAARVTAAPTCRRCEARLQWRLPQRFWQCSECADTPSADQLAAWCREQEAGSADAGEAHNRRDVRANQIARGAPGAAARLLRAANEGGAPSRAYLLDTVTGAERRALAWALRAAGDRSVSASQCRAAAAELARLTPADLSRG